MIIYMYIYIFQLYIYIYIHTLALLLHLNFLDPEFGVWISQPWHQENEKRHFPYEPVFLSIRVRRANATMCTETCKMGGHYSRHIPL